MNDAGIQSKAFTRAVLRSARVRIVGLIGALLTFAALVMVRAVIADRPTGGTYASFVILFACMIGYEILVLVLVQRLIRHTRDLPAWFGRVNVLIETSFPTVGLFLLIHSGMVDPYAALTAPVLLSYFFFIILSALRLKPELCVLTGLAAAAGYLAATIYVFRTAEAPDESLGLPMYATYGAILLTGGIVAGAVARQIRGHVQAAIGEAQARAKLEDDLRLARTIQQGLLPDRPPELGDYDIAGWSQPAEQTGGDYFDWFTLRGGRLAITLADVTGHGIGPALITANCHAYVHGILPLLDDPGAMIQRVNELLIDDLPDDRFVTLVAGILDPANDELLLLSVGHGPLIVYTAAGHALQEFNAHGVPLGVMAPVDYGSPLKISLAPGDMVVLLTDGFFEWPNAADELFGLERLREAILANSHLSSEAFIEALYGQVIGFAAGTPQPDDLTALVLKRQAVIAAAASEH